MIFGLIDFVKLNLLNKINITKNDESKNFI